MKLTESKGKTGRAGTKPASERTAEKVRGILDAALQRCRQYGYKHTSMEDIAGAAGVSRPALYLHFRNKEEIVRALSQRLHDEALESVESALSSSLPFRDRLAQALAAWGKDFVELRLSSPHGHELMDSNNRFAGEISQAALERCQRLFAQAFRNAQNRDEIDLRSVGINPAACSSLLLLCLHGIQAGMSDAESIQNRVDDLLRILDRAIGRK